MCGLDPWSQIIGRLSSHWHDTASTVRLTSGRRKRGGRAAGAVCGVATIRSIEWQTDTTVLVSWSDATRGRYLDQTWRASYARVCGVCAVSGMSVKRGDVVFRPFYRGAAPPPNALDMILASVLRR
ncbi:hypothetical protein CIC12_13295 [Burkholderia sp. SG-MS1]|uniref:DUF3331 domain-containing protein n=1 Tax=Paraburkholderia sp. SG-MS1 TaxID=2023741 RepID=UPI0014476FD5|nr:DUF3331 domain-containing protein [Paraburkholderia sp. SG-MS1]NKJ47700.1 hypothetical protein [Paraburkholderia sp. SG-MS1]